jgi:hypothetical protein
VYAGVKEQNMNAATVLRVFKNSSLVTEKGEFKINRVFDDDKATSKARYRYHCTVNGITVYSRRGKTGKSIFAVVDN